MKKHHVLGLALLAVFAFSAIMAVSASAEVTLLAEWLISEKAVVALTAVEITGELLLEDVGAKGHVICSGIFDGSVGASGEAEITAVLTLAGALSSLTAPILCKSAAGSACEENATDIEVAAELFPWHALMYLKAAGTFSLIVQSKAEYVVKCLALGLTITDTCSVTGAVGAIANSATSAEEKGEALPLAECTLGGKESGQIEPLAGNTVLTTGGTAVFVSSIG